MLPARFELYPEGVGVGIGQEAARGFQQRRPWQDLQVSSPLGSSEALISRARPSQRVRVMDHWREGQTDTPDV